MNPVKRASWWQSVALVLGIYWLQRHFVILFIRDQNTTDFCGALKCGTDVGCRDNKTITQTNKNFKLLKK